MNPDALCMGCMADRRGAIVCAACGYREGTKPESPLFLPPRVLLNEGQYLIGKVLGHGGFGITYLGWDLNLDLKLAIKEFLPRDLAGRSTDRVSVTPYGGELKQYFDHGLGRFLDEARALARFQEHPNIVKVLQFFRENGTGYIVMSFVAGTNFHGYLSARGGKVPYGEAIRILTPVMDGLKVVHEAGMLHRDVSPDNVYVAESGHVKIIDFGAVKMAVGERSRSLSAVLKYGYAPPEQYSVSGNQGPWTDVYALGATLYRAVTGGVPPDALERERKDVIAWPSALGIAMPSGAEAALKKALSPSVEQRFQSVTDFQRALAASEVPEKKELPPDPVPRPWSRAVVVASAVAVLLLGWIVSRLFSGSSPRVVSINFPSKIAADGNQIAGTVRFTGDVVSGRFEVVESKGLRPFAFDVTPEQRQAGVFPFSVRTDIPQKVVEDVIVTNASGASSEPYRFSFEATASAQPTPAAMPTFNFWPTPAPLATRAPSVGGISVKNLSVRQEGDAFLGSRKGIRFWASFEILGAQGKKCYAMAIPEQDRSRPIPTNDASYRTDQGYLAAWSYFTPSFDDAIYRGSDEIGLFVPYDLIVADAAPSGVYSFSILVKISYGADTIASTWSDTRITHTLAGPRGDGLGLRDRGSRR